MVFEVQDPKGGEVPVCGYLNEQGFIIFPLGDFLAPCIEDPYFTTTYGVGELLLESIVLGARGVFLELPGRFPYDGGMGVLSALGVRFLDTRGRELTGVGDNLERVVSLDFSSFLKRPEDFRVVLFPGDSEGSPIRGIDHFARLLALYTGERPLDFRRASGIGMGLSVFWGIEVARRRETCG